MTKLICLVSLLLALSALAFPQSTILVPSQYATIPAAIAAASNGDVILVDPGSYSGPINFLGKAITLRSVAGYESTTITGNGTATVVNFESGETSASILEGFTITGGVGAETSLQFILPPTSFFLLSIPPTPGGMKILNSSPIVRRCRFVANVGGAAGPFVFGATPRPQGAAGAITVHSGSPVIEDCRIESNVGGLGGSGQAVQGLTAGGPGGLAVLGGTPTIRRILFKDNHGGTGGRFIWGGTSGSVAGFTAAGGAGAVGIGTNISIETSIFVGNIGGDAGLATGFDAHAGAAGPGVLGAVAFYTTCVFRHVTTVSNFGGAYGDFPIGGAGGVTRFENCIIRDVCAPGFTADGLNYVGTPPTAALGFSILDPKFVFDAEGVPRLSSESPCMEAGSTAFATSSVDFDGAPRIDGCFPDLGATEFAAPPRVGTCEDFVIGTAVDSGVDRRALVKPYFAGQSLAISLATPNGGFADRVVALVAEIFPNGVFPASPFGYPEIKVSLPGAVVFYDGFTANPADPVDLPMTGSLTLNFTLPVSMVGFTARIQGIAFNPNAQNSIFAATNAVDFILF